MTCASPSRKFIVINDIPTNKSPRPDGLTGRLYKLSWSIIKVDIMNTFKTFWSLNSASFHLLNDAYMILLKKKTTLELTKD